VTCDVFHVVTGVPQVSPYLFRFYVCVT